MKSTIGFIFVLLISVFSVAAQRPEVTITLNETFFDGVLDALFQNAGPIEFAIASNGKPSSPGPNQALSCNASESRS